MLCDLPKERTDVEIITHVQLHAVIQCTDINTHGIHCIYKPHLRGASHVTNNNVTLPKEILLRVLFILGGLYI